MAHVIVLTGVTVWWSGGKSSVLRLFFAPPTLRDRLEKSSTEQHSCQSTNWYIEPQQDGC
jgi:hypothetical protein